MPKGRSKAYLRGLRKKYGLGEFKRRKKGVKKLDSARRRGRRGLRSTVKRRKRPVSSTLGKGKTGFFW